MLDTNALDNLVRAADPAVSDADLASQLSVAVKTPKPDRVTYTTCAGVWGSVAAATFREAIKVAITNGGPFGALADFIDTLLQGPGIDPSNAEVPTQSAAFVANSLATQQQVDGVFYIIGFPAGEMVTGSDVTASRARIAKAAGYLAARQLAANQYNAAIDSLSRSQMADAQPPLQTAVLAMLGTLVA